MVATTKKGRYNWTRVYHARPGVATRKTVHSQKSKVESEDRVLLLSSLNFRLFRRVKSPKSKTQSQSETGCFSFRLSTFGISSRAEALQREIRKVETQDRKSKANSDRLLLSTFDFRLSTASLTLPVSEARSPAPRVPIAGWHSGSATGRLRRDRP